MTLLDKEAHRESILVGITGSEALVGHVEEGKVTLLLHNGRDLLPLFLGGVDTSGVVSAGVQKNDAVVRGSLQISDHSIKVEADGILVIVLVLLDLETGVGEDSLVVRPAGSGNVDALAVRVEALKESTANTECASAGDGLGDGNAILLDGSGVRAVGELRGSRNEVRDTSDAWQVNQICEQLKAACSCLPAYSLSICLLTTFCSASRTEGRTYGLPLSSPDSKSVLNHTIRSVYVSR
jgi:hypothetical protein